MKNAIITVSDKTNIDNISNFLLEKGYTIYSTGGTYEYIKRNISDSFLNKLIKISDLTHFPEILNGRVKSLHPLIYGGILADIENNEHMSDINNHNIKLFSVVIVNLYLFKENNCIENIDIGGVSLIRACAKNFKNISLLTHHMDYSEYMNSYDNITDVQKQTWALKGFELTCDYDKSISNYYKKLLNNNPEQSNGEQSNVEQSNRERSNVEQSNVEQNNREQSNEENLSDKVIVNLKYGFNPHQSPSALECYKLENLSPFEIINGTLGYINVLDFLHGWLMVYEIFSISDYHSFISMKHTSPAGLGVGNTITQETLDIFGVNKNITNLSSCEMAFIKSRNCDPLSSFGDFICYSGIVDVETAKLIKREVCDGIAACGFEEEALEILKSKKNGKFIIIKMNEEYYKLMDKKGWSESKTLYGITISQPYNNFKMKTEYSLDAIIAYTILKYSQSNNISMVYNGQLLGIGCGQQNRVSCVELAGKKAQIWKLRHLSETIAFYKKLPFSLKRQEKVNKVYDYIYDNYDMLNEYLKLNSNYGITLGSDGFFPFTDNIYVANKYGVKEIIQPGGSIMDSDVSKTCEKLNIKLQNINTRMFYH